MARRGLILAGAALGLSLLGGGVGLVTAQESPRSGVVPPTQPIAAGPAVPATAPAASGAPRDYTIGTVTPKDAAVADAAPEEEAVATAEDNVQVKPVEPLKRPRFTSAILQAVDKVTAQTLRFEAKVGQPVRFKGLVVTVNACETTASDEDATDAVAHLSVFSQPDGMPSAPPRDAFRGWMFANAPAVHPFQHPVYDVWLIACKAASPAASPPTASR